MEIRYFAFNNKPVIGKNNLIFCSIPKNKKTINCYETFLVVQEKGSQKCSEFKLDKRNNYDTTYFLLNAFIDKKIRDRELYRVKSYELIPIKKIEKRKYQIRFRIHGTISIHDDRFYPYLGNALESLLVSGVDCSDFLKEITEEEFYNDEQFRIIRNDFIKEKLIKSLYSVPKNFEIEKKWFDKSTNKFYIKCFEKSDRYPIFTAEFSEFNDFLHCCNNNLDFAKLIDFDFDGIDLSTINLSKAEISSSIMKKIGIYDNAVHKQLLQTKEECLLFDRKSEFLPVKRVDINEEEFFEQQDDGILLYISDLHINHKLLKKFPEQANDFEIDNYFREIVIQLKNSIPTFGCYKNIVFVGDVSFRFDMFKRFFKIYREEISNITFFVLGNHELWDFDLNSKTKNLDEVIEIYRDFLKSLNIYLLQNELFIPNDEKGFYNASEIIEMSGTDLRKLFRKCSYAYYGGIGFAGLNSEFNYDAGIYRKAHIDKENEFKNSLLVNQIHEKLRKIVPNKKIFFITHMPMSDWSKQDYQPGWIYISGHTHAEYYLESNNIRVYEDNQVGYDSMSFGFKFITRSTNYDYFDEYQDGIYEITIDDYKLFNYGIGARCEINRKFDKIFLVKKNRCYCFLATMNGKEKLHLLNGGSLKNAGDHDLQYFYDNLDNYATSVNAFVKNYFDFQKNLSKEIKKIGGSGRIHGCIVDIDFYNHIYVNPLDGTMTPYYALSMVDKTVYDNLISLVKENCPIVYKNLKQIISSSPNALTIVGNELIETTNTYFYPETDMYRINRIMRSFQYTSSSNVVRIWNDTIVANCSAENGKLILSGIINPDEQKKLRIEQKTQANLSKKVRQTTTKKVREAKPKTSIKEKFSEKVFRLSNGNIEVVEYTGAKNKASFLCKSCGSTFSQRADHYIERHNGKCPICKK